LSTIKDVARLAGVGLGTVSRLISGKGSVSARTAERVRRAMEQLDYRPSYAARTLPTGISNMIGVYIPMLKGTFYTPILQIIHAELYANGQNMVVAFGSGRGNAREQVIEGVGFLMERGCDGFVVVSNALHEDDVATFGSMRHKVVVLNHRLKAIAEQCFPVDHRGAGALAARVLLDLKHRDIAVIGGLSEAPDNQARLKGFMGRLAAHGIDPQTVPLVESDFSAQGGWHAAAALIETGSRFSALFCANDEMALGALSYFQQAGIAVPAQISVLAYDDTQTAEYSAPRLTSVHIPWQEITVNGIRWLLNRCYGADKPVRRKFKISVTMRASLIEAPHESGS